MNFQHIKPMKFFHWLKKEEKRNLFCAGFERSHWRVDAFVDHLIEWLPDYALVEDMLKDVNHGNLLYTMKAAAHRVYTTDKYKKRGETGEIALHAICRQFFNTVSVSNQVFYISSANDTIKGFDLVHAHYLDDDDFEVWLGESKYYTDTKSAVYEAKKSIEEHLGQGFLTSQKLLMGPQLPRNIHKHREISDLFHPNTSIDDLLAKTVFVVGVLSESEAVQRADEHCAQYLEEAEAELSEVAEGLLGMELTHGIKMKVVYLPLEDKAELAEKFDQQLKAWQ